MTTDIALAQPDEQPTGIAHVGADPTGGRLVAWAQALAAAHRIGTALCSTSFVPAHFRGKPDESAAAILYGDEVGFSPAQAMQQIFVIGGKPALYARGMVALLQAAGHEVWTVEKNDETVTVSGRRRGSQHVVTETWTGARAKRAGYTNNAKYQTDPQAMLYARAASDVCRQVAADVLAGIGYSVEEMQLTETEQPASGPRQTGLNAIRAALGVEQPEQPEPVDVTDAEVLPDLITDAQLKAIMAGFGEVGLRDRALRLAYCRKVVGREIGSSKDLTKDEASRVLDALNQDMTVGGATDGEVE